MREAHKKEYFVDGFLIKHFGIWPFEIDKNNLFNEQKIFLVYLMAAIPSFDDWTIQINYQKELDNVDNLKEVKIDQSDLDVAKLQGRNIEEIKKERLSQEKQRRIVEINKKYGVEKEVEIPEKFSENQVSQVSYEHNERKELWNVLEGKGLIGKNSGLQNKT